MDGASDKMVVAKIGKFWLELGTFSPPIVASCVKTTSRRWVEGARDIAFYDLSLSDHARIGNGHSRQQCLRVGMSGVAVNFVSGGHFHNLPQIHDGHPVAHVFDHA